MHTLTFNLKGINCEACLKLIKRKVEKVPGIIQAIPSITGHMTVSAEREIPKQEISQALADTDYKLI